MIGNHKQAHSRGLVTRTGAVAGAGVKSNKLAPQQLGFFPDNPQGGDPSTVATLNARITPAFRIGYGVAPSAASANFHGGVENHWISELIYANQIEGYQLHKAKKLNGFSQGEIWTVGYDGIDASKTLESSVDWVERILRIKMWGTPISKGFGNYQQEVEMFFDKTCIPVDCVGNKKIAANYLADNFIKRWNSYKYPGTNKLIKDFVKVTKLRLTNPAQSAKVVACNQYKLVIPCDEGGSYGLGRIAAQYPGYEVVLDSHNEATKQSTYLMWRTVAQGAPAAATISDVIVPDCTGVVPSGYTAVAAAKVFKVIIAAGGTVAALTGEISRTKISSSPLEDVYLILTATTTTLATAITNVGTTGNPIVTEEGTKRALWTLTTPLSYTWAACKTAFKGSKTWRITLQDKVCEGCTNGYTDRLADLQAKYPDLTIATEEAGDCIHTYTTTTYSDCTREECGEDAVFDVNPPFPFERFMYWEEYTADLVTVPDCTDPVAEAEVCEAVGLRFETAVFKKFSNEYEYGHFSWDSSDADPVMINITVASNDYTKSICDVDTKMIVRKVQEIEYERGGGNGVRELEYRWFNYYNTGIPFEKDFVIRNIYGGMAIAKPEEYYDEVVLKYKVVQGGEKVFQTDTATHSTALRIFFKEGTAQSFINVLNGLIASLGDKTTLKPLVY